MNLSGSVQVDQGFPRRVTRTSLVFGGALFLFLVSMQLQNWAYGYLLGAALGLYSFDVFRMAVRAFLRTERMKENNPIASWKKGVIAVLLVIKIPIWLVSIYAASINPHLPLFGFVGGIATPQFVMISKVVSKWLVTNMESTDQEDSSGELSMNNHTG